ncbi:ATL2 protein, partial [Polyodon spathula]|nr:ATL2 protein [Polyodon spathula]
MAAIGSALLVPKADILSYNQAPATLNGPQQVFLPNSTPYTPSGAHISHQLIKTMEHWSASAVNSYIRSLPSNITAAHQSIASVPGVEAPSPPGPPEVFLRTEVAYPVKAQSGDEQVRIQAVSVFVVDSRESVALVPLLVTEAEQSGTVSPHYAITTHAATSELQRLRTAQLWAAYRQAHRRLARLQGSEVYATPWVLPSMVGSAIAWTRTGDVQAIGRILHSTRSAFIIFKIKTEDGQSSNSLEEDSDVTAYWWGEWAKWTACTRTCGGGIKFQERHCLKQRRKTAVGKDNMTCTGTSKRYHLCDIQVSFQMKIHFCYNMCFFNNYTYETYVTNGNDYVHISSKPCDLHCTTVDGQRQLMVPARDGTSCKYSDYRGVCVNGRCEPIGCDGVLFSSHTLDKCGVCQGNGSSCIRVTGNFRKGTSQLVFVMYFSSQEAVTDLWKLLSLWNTHTAVTDLAGSFFFNGDYKVDSPQNFHAAGTIFKYRRPMDVYETGIEYIVAQGPIDQAINVLVWNQNGRSPYITYEYTVLRDPGSAALQTLLYPGTESRGTGGKTRGPISMETDTLHPHNGSMHAKAAKDTTGNGNQVLEKSTAGGAVGSKGQETNEVYEETAAIDCELGVQARQRNTKLNASRPNSVGDHIFTSVAIVSKSTSEELVPDSENLIRNSLLGGVVGSEELVVNMTTNRLFAKGEPLYSTEVGRLDPDYDSSEHTASLSLNGTLQLAVTRRTNGSGGFLFSNRTGNPVSNRTHKARNRLKLPRKGQGMSAADMYRWKLSSQEPCSSTCAIGLYLTRVGLPKSIYF